MLIDFLEKLPYFCDISSVKEETPSEEMKILAKNKIK